MIHSKLFSFILGLILSQKINLIGEIYLGEIFAVIYVLLNLINIKLDNNDKVIILFGILWAGSQAISDLINYISLSQSLKGIFSPIVLLSTYFFIKNYFQKNLHNLPYLLLAIEIGSLISLIISPTEYFLDNSWKWGLGSGLLIIFVIFYSFILSNKSIYFLSIPLSMFAIVSLMLNSRSMAIFPLVSAVIYYTFNKKNMLNSTLKSKTFLIKLCILLIPIIYIGNTMLSLIFSNEYVLSHFSEEDASKYKIQATGTYGVLLGGRSEILISSEAFLDKPLFGHGSWAEDKSGYIDKYYRLRQELGYSLWDNEGDPATITLNLIPTHSYLMGSLVYAGIFGGLFWIILLSKILRNYFLYINYLPYFFHFHIVGFIWAVLFSPFGASARWSTALFLASFFAYINSLKFNHNR